MLAEPHELISATRAQRRIFLLDSMDSTGLKYVINELLSFDGPLDVTRLVDKFKALTRDHESLRSTYRASPAGVAMILHADLEPSVVVFTASNTETAIDEFTKLARAPFDIRQEAPIRMAVASVGNDRHLVLLTGHHIAADGESLVQLITDLKYRYEHSEEPSSGAVQVDFGDYAMWEEENPPTDCDRQYWHELLRGVPTKLAVPSTNGASMMSDQSFLAHADIPKELVDGIEAYARKHRVTPFAVYLTAFACLQSQITQQSDVLVGVPVSARTSGPLRSVIGMMVDTLPVRATLLPDIMFPDLVRTVSAQLDMSKSHRALPLEDILDGFAERGRTGEQGVLDSLFTWDVTAMPEQVGGVGVNRLSLDIGAAKASLFMSVRLSGSSPSCTLEVRQSVATKTVVEAWARHFVSSLSRLLMPATALAETQSVFSPTVEDGAASVADGPAQEVSPATLMELWELIRGRSRDDIAVIDGTVTVTYEELHQRAIEVAVKLNRLGLKDSSRVAIEIPRGIDQYAAVLGILLHGSCYIPVDPAYPAERREYVLKDSACAAVISQSDEKQLTITLRKGASHPATTNTAYILYTSGSTGDPKGVVVSQASVVNLAVNQSGAFDAAFTKVGQFSSLSFDVSVAEMWMTWFCGGTLVVLNEGERMGLALERSIQRHAIDTLVATPTALASIRPALLPSLRHIVSTGEACPPALAEKVGPSAQLSNAYGPTEATVWATCATVAPGEAVSIGTPLPNVTARIGHPTRPPLLVGVCGELWLGGAGVATGYLGRPHLTDNAFIKHEGRRWYRTGDLAFMKPNGTFVVRGRTDDQVKVNGYRIETSAIEHVLLTHPTIQAAAVGAPIIGERAVLVAWLVVLEDLPEVQLRQWMSKMVPTHEMPTRFVQLAELPLTPIGKVDKRQLPIPDLIEVDTNLNRSAQLFVNAVWERVLGLKGISPSANFFDIGGNSLQALLVFEAVQSRFPATELTDIFRHPTISSLASAIEEPAPTSTIPNGRSRHHRTEALRRRRPR
jgi:amino acid adenylation domain-containing protein